MAPATATASASHNDEKSKKIMDKELAERLRDQRAKDPSPRSPSPRKNSAPRSQLSGLEGRGILTDEQMA